jgi:hypothetical protein
MPRGEYRRIFDALSWRHFIRPMSRKMTAFLRPRQETLRDPVGRSPHDFQTGCHAYQLDRTGMFLEEGRGECQTPRAKRYREPWRQGFAGKGSPMSGAFHEGVPNLAVKIWKAKRWVQVPSKGSFSFGSKGNKGYMALNRSSSFFRTSLAPPARCNGQRGLIVGGKECSDRLIVFDEPQVLLLFAIHKDLKVVQPVVLRGLLLKRG